MYLNSGVKYSVPKYMGRSSPGYFADVSPAPTSSPSERGFQDAENWLNDSAVLNAQREFLKVARSRYREQKLERFGKSAVSEKFAPIFSYSGQKFRLAARVAPKHRRIK